MRILRYLLIPATLASAPALAIAAPAHTSAGQVEQARAGAEVEQAQYRHWQRYRYTPRYRYRYVPRYQYRYPRYPRYRYRVYRAPRCYWSRYYGRRICRW